MKNGGLTVHYSVCGSTYWMGFAAINSVASVYLLSIGFTNTGIGILLAVAGILSALLQPVISSYADRPKSPALRLLLSAMGGLMLVLCALVTGITGRSLLLCGTLYCGAIALLQTIQPILNALGMDAVNQGRKLNFGLSRAFGSIGYATACAVMGIVTVKAGAVSVPASCALFFLLFTIASFTFPLDKSRAEVQTVQDSGTGLIAFVSRYRKFMLLLAGCMCVYIGHVYLNNFTLQIVQSRGGGESEMGISMAMAAYLEIPAMIFFTPLSRRFRCDSMLRVAAVFFLIKAAGTFLARGMYTFFLVQPMQMLGWGLMAVTLVYYVNRVIGHEDAVKGQSCATLSYTAASIIGSLTGGGLLDAFGVDGMLIAGILASALGVVLIFLNVQRTEIAA